MVTLFVAPGGSDANPGTHTKPFATLGHALAAARERRRAAPGPATITVRGGFYPLAETLALTGADSGMLIQAAPGETPVLSGGVRLTGWRQTAPGRWETTAPFPFEQLYVHVKGQNPALARRYRPTLPGGGWFTVARDIAPTPGVGFDRLGFAPGEVRADWSNPGDIEFRIAQVWTMARLKLASVDAASRTARFTGPTHGTEGYASIARGRRYRIENVKEALSAPGEWYLDRPGGIVTYLARPGENPNRDLVVAPRLEKLVTVDDAGNVALHGLTFAHAAWTCPPKGDNFPQAEVHVSAAVQVQHGRQIQLRDCTVRNVGGWAVAFGAGCEGCGIARSSLVDLGAGGVKIGETSLSPDPARAVERIAVSDCLIAHGGRLHPAAVGVWIGHAAANRILHNDIVDFYYTGISPGWSWGYGPSGAHHNELAWNHIRQIGQGVLSDMGGIYTLGVSPGTTLHHNLIHDIESVEYGGWGIYFDEGSSGILAENNLVYRTKSAPFHQHYGRDNIVRNNILALGIEAQLMRTRAEDHNSFTIERNVVYWREGPLLGSNWSGTPGKNFVVRGNLYWNAAGAKVELPPGDTTGKIADPRFVAPEKGDFRLRPDSPAFQLGFVPFDLSGAGRTGAKPYTLTVPRAFPPPPAPRPLVIDTGFEGDTPGERPSADGLTLSEEPGGGTIRVTDETAATGKRSLKFTDAPGQKASYNPHLFWQPKLTEGALVGTFALRHERGAVFYHEWRDASSPYKVGPSLRVAADGALTVAGRELLMLPAGQWTRLSIRCALGNGLWSLEVKLPGRVPPQHWSDLPCGAGKAFAQLQWWGFVADGTEPATFYLDDMSVKAVTP